MSLSRREMLAGGLLTLGAAQLPLEAYAQNAGVVAEPGAELYRLRITNSATGLVEISTSGGINWESLGKVVRSASTVALSTDIVTAVPQGSVAGVAPESILLRLPAGKGNNRTLRLLAAGEAATTASILTDLPLRSGLFRCLAPPLGSKVMLERNGQPAEVPANYLPAAGDRFLILVVRPPDVEPPTVTLENKPGGEVVYTATGGIPRILAKVKQPLKGIGRYAGTERQGSGSVISWTPTAVLISTSGRSRRPEENGMAAEERGGFVIQPAEPTLRGVTHPASQILLEALPEGEVKLALSPFFGLPAPITSGDPLDPKPTRVEVRIDDGEWEAMPDLRGAVTEDGNLKALEAALGGKRSVKQGITHLRIRFGGMTQASFERRVQLGVTPLAESVQRGIAKISANVMGEGVTFVQFYLNGKPTTLTNLPPYRWDWDTRKVPNGEHLIEIRGVGKDLQVIASVTIKVLVDN